MTSTSRSAPDSPGPAPASSGWVSAHAMAAGDSLAAWWRAPLARARIDAAGMAHPASEKDDPKALQEFVKPFQAAEEHADRMTGGLTAIAAMGLGGLFNASGAGAGSGQSDASSGHRSAGGSGVKTDPPAMRAPGVSPGKSVPGIPHPAPVTSPATLGRPSPRPGSRDGLPARTGAKTVLPPAPTGFEVWAEKAARKLARYASTGDGPLRSGANPPAGSGKNGEAAPALRRAPFIPPEEPETLARFKALVDPQRAGRSGSAPPPAGESAAWFPAPRESAGGESGKGDKGGKGGKDAEGGGDGGNNDVRNTVTPASPRYAESAGKPGTAGLDLAGLVRNLYPPMGRTPSSTAPGPGRDPLGKNLQSPVPAPFPIHGLRNVPSAIGNGNGEISLPADPASRVPAAAAPTVGEGHPLPGRGAETLWLQEEDDLAAKLHRLLRRQAKRRGVDLA